MRPIYHLVSPANWQREPEQPYRVDSLTTEGFIHCAFADQVAASANRFHATASDVLALKIDTTRLASSVREEASGSGKIFPHIYGPINRDAVVAAVPLQRDEAGRWVFQP